MSTPNIIGALAHIDAALHELTTEAWSCAVQADAQDNDNWTRKPPIEATIANELEIAGKWLGPNDKTNLLICTGNAIRQAVIEIVAAQQALGVRP
jgi:hypothetical protein